MSLTTLLYHDVFDGEDRDSSGYPGQAAGVYKMNASAFDEHLKEIDSRARVRFVPVWDALRCSSDANAVLTFDDGGISALSHIADRLESFGWVGHFFITTNCIDRTGFLRRQGVRELHDRGHVIGSHTCTHPARMWDLPRDQLMEEWALSRTILEDIVGSPVTTGSVPGGFYDRRVAEAAASAGLRFLFTSEPTGRVSSVDECAILGRFNIDSRHRAATAAAIAAGNRLPRSRQWLYWNAKKTAKILAGAAYAEIRDRVFRD